MCISERGSAAVRPAAECAAPAGGVPCGAESHGAHGRGLEGGDRRQDGHAAEGLQSVPRPGVLNVP